MKIVSLIFCFTLIVGCSTAKMLKSEESRKLLLESPQVQAVIKLEISERKAKWCAFDPMFRFIVQNELTFQNMYIPILSDVDSCD